MVDPAKHGLVPAGNAIKFGAHLFETNQQSELTRFLMLWVAPYRTFDGASCHERFAFTWASTSTSFSTTSQNISDIFIKEDQLATFLKCLQRALGALRVFYRLTYPAYLTSDIKDLTENLRLADQYLQLQQAPKTVLTSTTLPRTILLGDDTSAVGSIPHLICQSGFRRVWFKSPHTSNFSANPFFNFYEED